MKKLFIFVFIVIIASWLGVKLADDPGYVLFAFHDWTVEMPLWLTVVATIVGFLVFYVVIRLMSNLLSLGETYKKHRKQWRQQKAQELTNQGLVQIAEGNWRGAENSLLKAAHYSKQLLINYLAAARAAQEQNNDNQRDEYLRLAHHRVPGAEVAIGLTQAQLQLAKKQYEQALATLMHLQTLMPNKPYILKLLKKVYCQLSDWPALQQLLPKLKKYQVFNMKQLAELELMVYRNLLTLHQHDLTQAMEVWKKTPSELQKDNSLLTQYIRILKNLDAHNQAALLIQEAMKREWDSEMVKIYGQLITDNNEKQYKQAEAWLKEHINDANLLLTLGRVCKRQQLWGQARDYLQQSIELHPQAETYRELGELLQQLNETEAAMQNFHKGLLL